MNTYLITGGAGFIGSTLADKLISMGDKVVVIDNFCNFYEPTIKRKNIQKLMDNNNFKLYEVDVRNRNEIKKVFEENNLNCIVHLAAMAGVRESIKRPLLYQEVNGLGTQNILEEMKEHNINKGVFASSSSVYGNCKNIPFKESEIVDFAISPYAATKKANEVMCHVYHQLYNFDIMMLRFFSVYGPRQRPDLAISKFTKAIISDKPVTMYGNGLTSRDYTYVDDIVDGIIKSCNYIMKEKNVYEIINLGNSLPVSLCDMIKTISKFIGKEPIIQQLEMQKGDPIVTNADISKAKSLIHYQPKVSFEEGIKKYIQWFKEN